MRKIKFLEPDQFPNNEWYEEWKELSEKETEKVKQAYKNKKDYQFKAKIWGKVKKFLFFLSKGKCAYCESKVLDVSFGDVEHFRPKGVVTEDPSHEGYYWLAYNLKNLLPSCERCNRGGAKMNHFPLVDSITAYGPDDDINDEDPYLLHPYSESLEDEPSMHLKFAPPIIKSDEFLFVGTISGISEKGKKTIEICNLEREELNVSRQSSQDEFFIKYLKYLDTPKMKEIKSKFADGDFQHSASLMVVYESIIEKIQQDYKDVKSLQTS